MTDSSVPARGPAGPCLITGGSGFLGINLVRHLLGLGVAVRTLDIAPFDHPERDRVDARLGDVRDPGAVDRAMQGMRTVVHAAAALPLAPLREIATTAVDGTRLLLEAAARHSVERFVFISSTAVYGIPEHHPIVETDALHGVGPYGQSKIDAERLCEAARASGACVPVLRPKSFVGPERLGAFEILYAWAFEGRSFPVLGRGDNPYQLLDVADLCEAIERCLTSARDRVDDTFNVGALEIGTMAQNWQAVLDRAGHGRKVVRLPAAPAVFALRLLHVLGWSPLYEWIYETAGRHSVVSIERIVSRLDWVPRRSNSDALVGSYDWYVAHRDTFGGRTGTTHRVPWDQGFLRWAKWCF